MIEAMPRRNEHDMLEPARQRMLQRDLWGRDIRTLYNLTRADAEEFSEIIDRLELKVGVSLFPFEELQEALILAKQGKLEQPNAVIKISDR